jgi:hypothetical protein
VCPSGAPNVARIRSGERIFQKRGSLNPHSGPQNRVSLPNKVVTSATSAGLSRLCVAFEIECPIVRLGLLASASKKADGTKGEDLKAERQGICQEIRQLQEQIEVLGKKRREVPTRIKVGDLPVDSRIRLETERKMLTDTVKIMAYRVESAMLSLIRPHYKHAEQEGRQLIQEILQASGDLDVQRDTVTVTLEPLSSAHRTRVLEKLCETLNEQHCNYPGTSQKLTYGLRSCTINA